MAKDAPGKRIVVFGSINLDLIITTPKVPRMGETVTGSGFQTAAGGKGANQAVAAARLAADDTAVTFVGAVGDDVFGGEMRENLRKNNVDVGFVKTAENCPTGTAVILIHDGDNCIVIDPGANAAVSLEDAKNAEALIASADMLIVQLEVPLDAVVETMRTAKRHGVPLLLNPAPARPLDREILALADIITPNEFECEMLTGIPAQDVSGAAQAVAFFRDAGVKQVIITMGGNGCVYNSGDEIRHAPARKAKQVVDTTAAGDSFTAGVAIGLTEGKSIDDAIGFATAVGSVTVSRMGAQPSLPTRAEAEAVLREE